MKLTHHNAPDAGCGCRLQDTGVAKGQMREVSRTIARGAKMDEVSE